MLLFFKFIHSIKFRAVWLRISGYMTMNFGQHYPAFGQHDFGRDDFRATWPVMGIAWHSSPARVLFFNLVPRVLSLLRRSIIRWSHASFALKTSQFVSLLVPFPLEEMQQRLFKLLLRVFWLTLILIWVSFFGNSPWNNFRLRLNSLLSRTSARTLLTQIQRSIYFGVLMTFRNHSDDSPQNKLSLGSIVFQNLFQKKKNYCEIVVCPLCTV